MKTNSQKIEPSHPPQENIGIARSWDSIVPEKISQKHARRTSYICGILLALSTIPDIKALDMMSLEGESWMDVYTESLNEYFWLRQRISDTPPIITCKKKSPILWLARTHDNQVLISEPTLETFKKRKGVNTSSAELQEWFQPFIDCIVFQSDGTVNTELEEQNILDMVYKYVGFFPREVLYEKIQNMSAWNLHAKSLWGKAFPKTNDMQIDHNEYTTDTVPHEIIHLVFEHSESEKWTKKYQNDVWAYDLSNPTHFIDTPRSIWKYGRKNTYEDMATVGSRLFDQASWKNLRQQVKRSEVIRRKVEVIIWYFDEISDGLIDRKFFTLIESGKIKNAIEAQKYFAKKRIEIWREKYGALIDKENIRNGKIDDVALKYPFWLWENPDK